MASVYRLFRCNTLYTRDISAAAFQILTATFHPATYILVNVKRPAPAMSSTPAKTFEPQYSPWLLVTIAPAIGFPIRPANDTQASKIVSHLNDRRSERKLTNVTPTLTPI